MDRNRRPMTAPALKLPRYFQPGVQYVTMGDGSMRRADQRPIEVASAAQRPGRTLRMAWSYLRAELSAMIRGPVSEAVYQQRMGACMDCPRRIATPLDEVGFCGACGCGQTPQSALTVKGRMPAATCPLPQPRWMAADGAGATWGGVLAGLAGIARQTRQVLRRPRRTLRART